MRAIYILIFSLGLASIACSDLSETGAPTRMTIREEVQAEKLMRLAVGNYWIYDIEEYDVNGNLTDQYKDTVEIRDIKKIDKEYWFETYRYSNGDKRYYKNSDTAIIERCESCINEYTPIGFWPLDLTDGVDSKFYQNNTISNGVQVDDVQFSVYCKFENINVPAGNFDSFRYDHLVNYLEEDEVSRFWFNSKVGLILKEIYYNNNNVVLIKEKWMLNKYKLKK